MMGIKKGKEEKKCRKCFHIFATRERMIFHECVGLTAYMQRSPLLAASDEEDGCYQQIVKEYWEHIWDSKATALVSPLSLKRSKKLVKENLMLGPDRTQLPSSDDDLFVANEFAWKTTNMRHKEAPPKFLQLDILRRAAQEKPKVLELDILRKNAKKNRPGADD